MRRIVVFFLSLAGALLSAQCHKKNTLPTDTVVVGLQASPATLDPRFARDATGMRLGNLLFQSLVTIGPNLNVVGDAAESWKWKGSTISFVLRKGLTFSNGRPLTTEDIEFTFQEYRKPENPFRSSLELLDKVTTNEEKGQIRVDLKLKTYSAKLLAADLPMIRLLPAKEIQNNENAFRNKPFGTGPYQLVSHSTSQIQLKARKTHAVNTSRVSNVVFKIVKNSFTLYQKMLHGELDLVQSDLPLLKIKEFERLPDKFEVHKRPGLSFSYLLINHKDPSLKKKSIRQAIHYAINRDEIIRYKLEGFATPATSLMTPANPFHDKSLAPPIHAPETSKKRLDGRPLKLSLKTSTNRQAVENGKVIARQLKAVGIDVELKSFEWGTYFSDVQNGRFQLATMRWVGAVDPDLYRMAFHSGELPPGRNRGAYINKDLDALLDKGLGIADREERIRHYYKVQKIVLEDLAIVPLWYDQQVSVVNRRVKNYTPSMNGDFSPLLHLDIIER